jgi:hypothetical protein
LLGTTPDSAYERKIATGLLQPTWDYLTPAEAHATVNGRYKGDGRRIDQYIDQDPLGIYLEDPVWGPYLEEE